MAKLTLTDLTNLQNEATAVAAINANNALIEAALELTVSRNNQSPNTWTHEKDANSQRLFNLPEPQSATEPLRLGDISGLYNTTGILLQTVTSKTELKALDTVYHKIAFDRSELSGGTFEWRLGNYTTAVANDPGEGIYRKADAISASVGCWVRRRTDLKVYPEWFGAVKDGTTNDYTAIQRAASICMVYGWDLALSSGKYGLAATVYIDYAAHTSVISIENRTVNIVGEGSGNTQIVHSGFSGTAFGFTGKIISSGVSAKQYLSGFSITAAVPGAGTGITMDNIAYATFVDVSVFSMNRALDFQDVLTSSFHGCILLYGVYGLRLQFSDFSRPNAISFHGCSLAGFNERALEVIGGTAISFFGGSIESNGNGSVDPNRSACLFTNPGVEGGVAFSAYGLHVENNSGLADFLFNLSSTDPSTIGFYSCNLQRGGSLKVTNNILVQQNTSTTGKVVLTCSSSFRHFSGYTPDAAEKAIRFISDPACEYEVHDTGSYYGSSLYRWSEASDNPFGIVRFAGATGTVAVSRNVDSVTRSAVGTYVVNLRGTMVSSSPIVIGMMTSAGSVVFSSATTSTVTVLTRDNAGTLIDPSTVHIVIYEGA